MKAKGTMEAKYGSQTSSTSTLTTRSAWKATVFMEFSILCQDFLLRASCHLVLDQTKATSNWNTIVCVTIIVLKQH